jgi:hypothetical protein
VLAAGSATNELSAVEPRVVGRLEGPVMKRTAQIHVISFVLLSACGALCQGEGSSANRTQGLRFDGKNSQAGRQEMPNLRSLPDAPSVQRGPQAGKFQMFVNEAGSPLTLSAVGVDMAIMRTTDSIDITPRALPGLTTLYKDALIQKESSAFFGRYLYASLLKQDPRYYPSTSGSFLGRATYAVSRILITRRDSGDRTLNTSYFLGVLTSVAIATAYRPYWTRSSSSTFKTFGSTMGSDAGINLLHEFRPEIRQMLKGHSPIVSKLKRIATHDQSSRDAVSIPPR